MTNPFAGKNVLSTKDFSKHDVEYLMETASKMKDMKQDGSKVLSNKIMASMFLEPSTRTRLSFDAAMKRLGGQVVGFSDWEKSSFHKGETLSDTLRVVENYADVVVLRSKYEGAARYAASILEIPVINAGSGSQEHPTQAFLDLACIKEEKGYIDGLTIGLCGDLHYGRTVHSLVPLLARYDITLVLISPESLGLRDEDKASLKESGVTFKEVELLETVIGDLDCLYMTRIQRERFPSEEDYRKVRGFYVLNQDTLKGASDQLLLMHPLPRINEIDPGVDALPQAVYFKQPMHGLHVRMALLALIFDIL
ncbi:aspartate carbamoyltransferase [Candidatus Bathyarchaeota archaeon]|nr:aspartate carbamoyltransferase [Candidatus Bathyarchaeota archaeon]